MNFLAIGQFGFVGRFFANVLRIFVGETYIVVSFVFILIGIYLLIKGKKPSLKSQRWLGGFLLFCALVVWQHAQLFSPIMNADVNIISATWRMFVPQFTSVTIGQSIGGGMIGAVLYATSYFLFSSVGTYLMMAMFIFIGIMTMFQLSYKNLLERLRSVGARLLESTGKLAGRIKESHTNRKNKKKKSKKSQKPKRTRTEKPVTEEPEVNGLQVEDRSAF